MKKSLQGFFLVSASVVITILLVFLIGEIICRIKVPFKVMRLKERELYFEMMREHPKLGRVLKANYSGKILQYPNVEFAVKSNSKGLRDRNFTYKKLKNTKRILVLGDSFTFGYGVEAEETYPKLLEKYLNKKKQKVEVINAGMTGWGLHQQNLFLQEEGIKYQPDLVLVGFFMNDISDYFSFERKYPDLISYYYEEKKRYEDILKRSIIRRIDFKLKNLSYFYTFLNLLDEFTIFRQKLKSKSNRQTLGRIKLPLEQRSNEATKGQTIIDQAKVIQEPSTIISWQVHASIEGKAQLQIWRKNQNSWFRIAEGPENILETGHNQFNLKYPLKAEKGDLLGIYTSNEGVSRNAKYTAGRYFLNGRRHFLSKKNDFKEDQFGDYSFSVEFVRNKENKINNQQGVLKTLSRNEDLGDITQEQWPFYKKHYTIETERAFEGTLNLMTKMYRFCKKKNIPMIVLNLPDWVATNMAPELVHTQSFPKSPYSRFQIDKPHNIIRKRLATNEIPLIELLKPFRQSKNRNLYVIDGHFNAAGHQLAARTIYQKLERDQTFEKYFY